MKRIAHDPNNEQVIRLKKGDAIKLGRAVIRVSDMKFGEEKTETEEYCGPYQDEQIELKCTKTIPR